MWNTERMANESPTWIAGNTMNDANSNNPSSQNDGEETVPMQPAEVSDAAVNGKAQDDGQVSDSPPTLVAALDASPPPPDATAAEGTADSNVPPPAAPALLESMVQDIKAGQARQHEMLEAAAGALGDVQDRLTAIGNDQGHVVQMVKDVHRQLQSFAEEGHAQSPRSLINDLFRLYDLAIAMGDTLGDRPMIPVQEFRDRLSLISVQIDQVFQLNGLEKIEPQVGEAFNARLHNARAGVQCGDSALHRTIKTVHHPGFSDRNFVLRPAAVDVWICEAKPRTADASAGTASSPAVLEASPAAGGNGETKNGSADKLGTACEAKPAAPPDQKPSEG
jgi:molecular chaperone GrpE (heat shock protein)